MRRITAITLTTLTAAAITLGLAACSGSSNDTAPEPSATSSTEQTAAPAAKTGVCDADGQFVITKKDLGKDKTFTVEDSCRLVSVLVNDATITIGADIEVLTLEGAGNTVHANGIGEIAVFGAGNTIDHTGPAPKTAETGVGVPGDTVITQK